MHTAFLKRTSQGRPSKAVSWMENFTPLERLRGQKVASDAAADQMQCTAAPSFILLLVMTKRTVKSFSTRKAVTMTWCRRATPQRSVLSILVGASNPPALNISALWNSSPAYRCFAITEKLKDLGDLEREGTSAAHF